MKLKALILLLFFIILSAEARAFESELPPGEGLPQYTLIKSNISIYSSPDQKSSPQGKLALKPGTKLLTLKTLTRTLSPGKIVYPKNGKLHGRELGKIESLSEKHYYDENIPSQELAIPQGTELEYLMYRAEGNYLVKYQDKVWEMAPSIEIKKTDPKLETWIQLKSGQGQPTGWLLVKPEEISIKKSIGD